MNIFTKEQLAERARREYKITYDTLEYRKNQYANRLQSHIQACVHEAKQEILAIKLETESAKKLFKYDKDKRNEKRFYVLQREKENKVKLEANNFIISLKNSFNYEIESIRMMQLFAAKQLNTYLMNIEKNENNKNKSANSKNAIAGDMDRLAIKGPDVDVDGGEHSDGCEKVVRKGNDGNERNDERKCECECETTEGKSEHESNIECYLSKLNDISDKLLLKVKHKKQLTTRKQDSILNEYTALASKISAIGLLLSKESDNDNDVDNENDNNNDENDINIVNNEENEIEKVDNTNAELIELTNAETNNSNDCWSDSQSRESTIESIESENENEKENESVENIIEEEIKEAIKQAIEESKRTGKRLPFSMKSKIKREIRAKYANYGKVSTTDVFVSKSRSKPRPDSNSNSNQFSNNRVDIVADYDYS